MKKQISLILIFVAWASWSHAQIKLGGDTILSFAAIEEARQILTAQDDFVQRMSPFDRAARLKTGSDVSETDYLDFAGKNILAWDDNEKQKITAALQSLQEEFKTLPLPFPKKIVLIKTTGKEEGDAAYTRANAIILPESQLKAPGEALQKLICHELFHILSRQNPELRDELYTAIGFVACDEIEFPEELKARKITNPDAPANDHCIRLKVDDAEHWAIPILFSKTEKYDVARGGEFFNYLQFKLLLVQRDDDSSAVKPLYDGATPRLIDPNDASGFFEQIGQNTSYIIHPEEILADNFVLLVLHESGVRSPEILEKMDKILKENKSAAQSDGH
ncbi:hypothetical protein JXA32_03910 [Candidatus Sumerlaeota bacterium]|nr:hypothetical protein [Candidatus Sumerlaeota bacterium]